MAKVKIGDKVRVTNQDGYSGDCIVISVNSDSNCISVSRHDNGNTWNVQPSNYIIISSTIENMNLIEKAKLAFKKETEKSFIIVGVMDSNENLTADGKELLLAYLLEKNKDDFKTVVVDPILKEETKAE